MKKQMIFLIALIATVFTLNANSINPKYSKPEKLELNLKTTLKRNTTFRKSSNRFPLHRVFFIDEFTASDFPLVVVIRRIHQILQEQVGAGLPRPYIWPHALFGVPTGDLCGIEGDYGRWIAKRSIIAPSGVKAMAFISSPSMLI